LPSASDRPRCVGYRGRRRRLLIADDEPHNRDVLRQLLEPLGFTTVESSDGLETLAEIRRSRPDLLLVDLVMPEMDGLDVTRTLRSEREFAQLPVIALSASAFADTVRECRAAGCNEFVPKPVNFDLLLDAIGRCLELEWITQPTARQDALPRSRPAQAGECAITPAAARRLFDLALRGDVAALSSEIAALEQSDGELRELATRLRVLTDSFDMKGVRTLLGSAMAD